MICIVFAKNVQGIQEFPRVAGMLKQELEA